MIDHIIFLDQRHDQVVSSPYLLSAPGGARLLTTITLVLLIPGLSLSPFKGAMQSSGNPLGGDWIVLWDAHWSKYPYSLVRNRELHQSRTSANVSDSSNGASAVRGTRDYKYEV
jgi:hypothetical protein